MPPSNRALTNTTERFGSSCGMTSSTQITSSPTIPASRALRSGRTSSGRLPFYNGHDRTFFFVDYEGTRIRQKAGSTLNDEPPATFRSGDFSSSSTIIYDPATRVLGPNGVVTDQPFQGNMIPSSRLDPAAVKYQSLIPTPNVGGANSTGPNYLAVTPTKTDRN